LLVALVTHTVRRIFNIQREDSNEAPNRSTSLLAINHRRSKSSKMPVMTVRDEREKMKRVSPLLVLPTEWTREKVEYTRVARWYDWQGFASYTCSRVCGTHSLLPDGVLGGSQEYGWQGQVRFQKYRKTLTGNARTKLDLSVAAGPQNFQLAS
jgi:hypothetical protein